MEFTFADLSAVFAVVSAFLPADPSHDVVLAGVHSPEVAAALAKVRSVVVRDDDDRHVHIQVRPFTVLGGPCGD